eukprot:2052627-Pyramimonas_sp.AAC.1
MIYMFWHALGFRPPKTAENASVGRLVALLERSKAVLGLSRGPFGRSVGPIGPVWGPLGGFLGCLGAIVEASWEPLGPSSAVGSAD